MPFTGSAQRPEERTYAIYEYEKTTPRSKR
jgi:hypothetical protein